MGRTLGKPVGGGREGEQDRVWAISCHRLALGAQFQVLHWHFESQGGGSQGVDHVLVTFPTVLS